MEINLVKYGTIIADTEISNNIYNEIKSELLKNENIVLNFSEVKTMTTVCSKQIFGRLYIEMKSNIFYEKIHFKNADNNIRILINIGIDKALKELDIFDKIEPIITSPFSIHKVFQGKRYIPLL